MFSPVAWAVGDTSPWTIDLTLDNNNVADLTNNMAINMAIYSATKVLIGNSASQPAPVQLKPGILAWQPASGDVAAAGTFYLRVVVTYATYTKKYDQIQWVISP